MIVSGNCSVIAESGRDSSRSGPPTLAAHLSVCAQMPTNHDGLEVRLRGLQSIMIRVIWNRATSRPG